MNTMKIAFNEIWNFIDLLESSEQGWGYALVAGDVIITNISTDDMLLIKNDTSYDTELLPSIFTFREILWQPDVFTEAGMSMPALRILEAFCEEVCQEYEEKNTAVAKIYKFLLKGISNCSSKTIEALEYDSVAEKKILGNFRTCVFPIIKFFIYHPQNRHDYFQDAQNRLNYAVKIMLTQFYGRYTALEDPYWKVSYSKKKKETKKENTENFN